MPEKANCARGETLTVPYAWLETNIGQEQAHLLTAEDIDLLLPRLARINASRWCFDHWLELLDTIEKLMGISE